MTATPTSVAPPAERRVAPRRQPAMGTVCHYDLDEDKASTGLVWNISTSGVSMLATAPKEPGSGVRGVLETIRGRHPLPVGMKIVHVKLLETGDYLLGAHFDRPLTEKEMKPFVA